MTPDLDQARKFLELLDPDAERFTFQTFDDSEQKRGHLAKVLHGTLDELAGTLTRLQKAGAGVFVTVNETDLKGRKAENITRARSAFVDLDGAPVQPVMACQLEPHVVVESSPGRFHAYWLAHRLRLNTFGSIQKSIIRRFGGDKSVHDLPRVMRLPGFVHQKSEPFQSRIVQVNVRLPYEADALLEEFAEIQEQEKPASPNGADGQPSTDNAEERETMELVRALLRGEDFHSTLLALAMRFAKGGMPDPQIIITLKGMMSAVPAEHRGSDSRWLARFNEIPRLLKSAREKIREPEAAAKAQPQLVMLDDCQLDADVFWTVEDVLPRCNMLMIYARGGSGKTYLGTSLAFGIGTGQWFDHTAEHGAVLICAFERPEDTEDRLAALRDMFGLHGVPIALLKLGGQVLDKDQADFIIASAKLLAEQTSLPVRAIEIDTVSAALGGAKEDDEGLGRLRRLGERIHAETGALVVWIHHEGKGDQMGPRGHLALADACTAWWHVEEREDASRVVHVVKATRGPCYQPLFAFKLIPFEAGRDRRGKAINLCELQLTALEPALASPVRKTFGQKPKEPKRLGSRQTLLHDALKKFSRRHPDGVDRDITRSEFILQFDAQRSRAGLPSLSPDDYSAAFRKALASLKERGMIEIHGDLISLTD